MNETRPPRRIGRSVLAVLAGFLVILVLSLGTDVALHASGVYPPWGKTMADSLFGLATAYRIVFGILGCWVAARLAPDRPMAHAMALGVVGVAISLAGLAYAQKQGPEFGPLWYSIAIVGISLPCAWIGGRIRVAQRRGEAAQEVA